MKTTLTTLVKMVVIALAISVNTAEAAPKTEADMGWFKKTFSKLEWSDIPSTVSTPKDICKKVRATVEFRTERGDTWSTGQETWNRGWGDCEDLAACITDLCHELNLDAKVVVFMSRGSRDAHAVVLGKYNGKMWISSNGWYATVDSIQEAKAVVAEEMGWETRNVTVTSLRNAM